MLLFKVEVHCVLFYTIQVNSQYSKVVLFSDKLGHKLAATAAFLGHE